MKKVNAEGPLPIAAIFLCCVMPFVVSVFKFSALAPVNIPDVSHHSARCIRDEENNGSVSSESPNSVSSETSQVTAVLMLVWILIIPMFKPLIWGN